MRAMKQVVKGWGGTRGCFCGLMLNSNLSLALSECQKQEIQLAYKQQGSPSLKGQHVLQSKVVSLQLQLPLVFLDPVTGR